MDDIDIVHRGLRHTSGGHGFAALGRRRLLDILHTRCRALGVAPPDWKAIEDATKKKTSTN